MRDDEAAAERKEEQGVEDEEEEEEWVTKQTAASTAVQGPFTRLQLLRMVDGGADGVGEVVVRRVGDTQWQPLSDITACMR